MNDTYENSINDRFSIESSRDADRLDDTQLILYDFMPEQELKVIEKYNLSKTTDSPIEAVTAILLVAAESLTKASLSARQNQAMTLDTARQIVRCKMMIADAEKLLTWCPPLSDDLTIDNYDERNLVDDDGNLVWLQDPTPLL